MKRVIGALLVLPLLAVSPASAIYLRINGIVVGPSGEEYGDWMEVLSFSIGREEIGDCAAARRATSSHQMGEVVVTRSIDKASPKLAAAAARGSSFEQVKLEFTQDDRDAPRADESGHGCTLIFRQVGEFRVNQRGGNETLSFGYLTYEYAPGTRT